MSNQPPKTTNELEDAYEIVKNSERWDTTRISVLCSLVSSLYAHLDNEESSSDFQMVKSMVSLSQQLSKAAAAPYDEARLFKQEHKLKTEQNPMSRVPYLAFVTRNQDLLTTREIVLDDCNRDDTNVIGVWCAYICTTIIKAAMNSICPGDILEFLGLYIHQIEPQESLRDIVEALKVYFITIETIKDLSTNFQFETGESESPSISTIKMMILVLTVMNSQFQRETEQQEANFDSMLQLIMKFKNVLGDGCAAVCALVGAYSTSLVKLEDPVHEEVSMLEISCKSRLYKLMQKGRKVPRTKFPLCGVFTAFDELYDVTAHFILKPNSQSQNNTDNIPIFDCERLPNVAQLQKLLEDHLKGENVVAQRVASLACIVQKIVTGESKIFPQALKYLCHYSIQQQSLFQRAPTLQIVRTEADDTFEEEAKFLYRFITNQVVITDQWETLFMEIFAIKKEKRKDAQGKDLDVSDALVTANNFQRKEKVDSKKEKTDKMSLRYVYDMFVTLKNDEPNQQIPMFDDKPFAFTARVILEAAKQPLIMSEGAIKAFSQITSQDEEEQRLFGRILNPLVLFRDPKIRNSLKNEMHEEQLQEKLDFFAKVEANPQIKIKQSNPSLIGVLIPPFTTKMMSIFQSPEAISARVQVHGRRTEEYYRSISQAVAKNARKIVTQLPRNTMIISRELEILESNEVSTNINFWDGLQGAVSVVDNAKELTKKNMLDALRHDSIGEIDIPKASVYCAIMIDDRIKCHGTLPLLSEIEWTAIAEKVLQANFPLGSRVSEILGTSGFTSLIPIPQNTDKIIRNIVRKFAQHKSSREDYVKILCGNVANARHIKEVAETLLIKARSPLCATQDALDVNKLIMTIITTIVVVIFVYVLVYTLV